jgi:hypothetical protein
MTESDHLNKKPLPEFERPPLPPQNQTRFHIKNLFKPDYERYEDDRRINIYLITTFYFQSKQTSGRQRNACRSGNCFPD